MITKLASASKFAQCFVYTNCSKVNLFVKFFCEGWKLEKSPRFKVARKRIFFFGCTSSNMFSPSYFVVTKLKVGIIVLALFLLAS